MSETAQQYTQRILANAQGQDPLKVQAATTKKLARLIKGVPTAKLRKRPAPEKWSIAEILAHVADVEIVIGWRMRSIIGAPGPPSRPSIRTPGSSPDTTKNAILANPSNCTA